MSEPMRISEVLLQVGPTFRARYESECAGCDELILPGDECRADGAGGWIHAAQRCQQAVATPARSLSQPPCSRCFQIPAINGSCACREVAWP